MSHSALESVKLKRKADLEKKRQLELKIDVDVQKLRAQADILVENGLMDNKGYYGFTVKRHQIEYEDAKIVIDRFCTHMEKLGYVVPQVTKKKGWREEKDYYIIRFRPSEEALAQMEEDSTDDSDSEDEDDEPSTSSSKK